MTELTVFQMKLGLDEEFRPGWLFSDEGPDDEQSFAYTIPYVPFQSFDQVELNMAGERAGTFEDFRLQFSGRVFVHRETGVRFAPHDVSATPDFRGLPFDQPLPYIGSGDETLRQYGLLSHSHFLMLSPLDLNRMDDAFDQHRMIFCGTTQSFGRHRQPGYVVTREQQGRVYRPTGRPMKVLTPAPAGHGKKGIEKIARDSARSKR